MIFNRHVNITIIKKSSKMRFAHRVETRKIINKSKTNTIRHENKQRR